MLMPTRIEKNTTITFMEEVHVDPLEGRILMFPSWLWHCVEPNESNDIRISVSFNFIQKDLKYYNEF